MSAPSITPTATPSPSPSSWGSRALIFLMLAVTICTYPNYASLDLDASWRMALGRFFLDGLQFGRDVVFTYGPLGFLMGKTYFGSADLFYALLGWQLFAAVTFSSIIMLWGERLSGQPRFYYYLFFALFGATYEDALHMLVIALSGFELLRPLDSSLARWRRYGLLALLGLLATIKFTDLMFGGCIVLVCVAHELWHRRYRSALYMGGCYAGTFLLIWMLCRQNPLNLPAYFINSWYISQGYQNVMGIATPEGPLTKAIIILACLALWSGYVLLTHPDRSRTLARITVLSGFIYLNWKHGFVRADGHMIGFFYCALLPAVTFPYLLDDGDRWPRLKRGLLTATGVLCLLGTWQALPGVVDSALGMFQNKLWNNTAMIFQGPTAVLGVYNNRLGHERFAAELPRTKALVGDKSVDVIGYNQGIALFNDLRYTPRPVIQSYSAYTPELAQLNARFYESDRAPDYVLIKIGSIDERLSIMDDAPALQVIALRYEFALSEKGFLLWRKKDEPYQPAAPAPTIPLELPLGQTLDFKAYAGQKTWFVADLAPSLLGRLRNLLYKPPHVYLVIEDQTGKTNTYRMAPSIGRTGFIINPVIDELLDYINYTANQPGRTVARLTIKTAPEDEKYFSGPVHITLRKLPETLSGIGFFKQMNRDRFHMFKSIPTAYETQVGLSEEDIDGKMAIIMHAPSSLTFECPPEASTVTGQFGFLKSAYIDGNDTNGADFEIVWSDGVTTEPLYHRYLNPVQRPEDRGLQNFNVAIKNRSGGRLYFKISPGPNNNPSWDWAGWSAIDIK